MDRRTTAKTKNFFFLKLEKADKHKQADVFKTDWNNVDLYFSIKLQQSQRLHLSHALFPAL